MTRSFYRSSKSGFTIVELLIVIVIIGILASLVVVSYNGVQQAARDKTVLSDAETVASEVTRYSTKNNGTLGSAVVWYSGGASNPNIDFTPSPGNVVDIVAGQQDYCIRVYNPNSQYNSLSNAYKKGSSADACTAILPSVAAGGAWVDTLAGWWPLNGNIFDASGNISTGTPEVIGAIPTTGANGQANSAYSFNGTSDYIKLGVSNTVGSLTNNLTVSVWVNKPSYSGAQAILAPARTNSSNGIGISLNGSGLRFTTYGIKDYNASTVTLPTGAWYMITAVMASNNTVSFYQNGVFQASDTNGAGGVANIDDTLQLGATTGIGNTTLTALYEGAIDDLRIYNYALSAGEVAALYAAGAQ
jgi:prepilin-type N-terminal cleavage/methylation domain-containing protein